MNKVRIPKNLENHTVLPLLFDERSGKFIVGTSEDYVSPHLLLGELPYKTDTLTLDALPDLCMGVVDGATFITGPKINKLLLPQTRMSNTMARIAVTGAITVMNDTYTELKIGDDTTDDKTFTMHHDTNHGVVKLGTSNSDAVFVAGRNGRVVRAVEMKPTRFSEYEALSANGFELVTFLAGMGHVAYKATQY